MKIATNLKARERDLTGTEFLTTRQEDVDLIMGQVAELIAPIGLPLPWFSNTIPDRFVLLDGRELPVRDFTLLRNVYAPVFGEDIAANTFTLPDMRGRSIIGLGTSGNLGSQDCGFMPRVGPADNGPNIQANWITRYK